jgi:formylglycine-generating enzyme required for sulfatase activity
MRKPVPRLVIVLAIVALGPGPECRAGDEPSWAAVSEAQRACARRHGVPVAFENHVGMRFVLIPEGSFTMGMPVAHLPVHGVGIGRNVPHVVTLTRPFYVQVTETAWRHALRLEAPLAWKIPRAEASSAPDLPAVDCSHSDVMDFAAHLSATDPAGRVYRLPTEAEWECACRGGKTAEWHWGTQVEAGERHEHLPGSEGATSRAVGSLAPNPYGLHDVLGNVCEMVLDRYGPLSAEPVTDPVGPRDLPREAEGLFPYRIVRGGDFTLVASEARAWTRRSLPTSFTSPVVGFRLASPLPSE